MNKRLCRCCINASQNEKRVRKGDMKQVLASPKSIFQKNYYRFLKVLLLNLSVSTRGVIGQFWGRVPLYGPVNLKVSFLARRINLRDIINILLTSFSRSVS